MSGSRKARLAWSIGVAGALVVVGVAASACDSSSDAVPLAADASAPDVGIDAPIAHADASDANADASDAAPLIGQDAAALLRPLHPINGSPPLPDIVRADADGIYVVAPRDVDGGSSLSSRIVRLDPSEIDPPRDVAVEDDYIRDLAVDDAYLYYALDESIRRVPKSGGAPTTLVTGSRIAVIAAYGADLYYATNDDEGATYRVPKAGGLPATIATKLYHPYSIDVTAAGLFVVEGGRLHFAPATGGAGSVLTDIAGSLVARGTDAYFINGVTSAEIARIANSGGPATAIAAGWDIRALAADDSGVYFVHGDGIARAALQGGHAVTLVADPMHNLVSMTRSIALTATRGYVTSVGISWFEKADPH
jgi:hypothetical protein